MSSSSVEYSVPIENAGQVGVLVSSALSILIPTLLVTLRFIAKRSVARSLDASDYCIVVALIFNIGLHIDCWPMVYRGAFGFHVADIMVRFGLETLTFFFKGIMCFALIWNGTICFSKLSVLLMYSALIPIRHLIIPARVLGTLIVLWNFSSFVAGLAMCQPIARNWDQSIRGGFCGDKVKYYMWLGIINVVTDVLILALPIPFVYGLNMKLRKRLVLIAMFSIGFFTCAITIYRQTMLTYLDFTDMPFSGLLATIFS
ncbi:hypothetical protein BKA67DRAFT_669379 [Truncatella angustata]|uniref:Rhodopsin domain-containing protein n=1 Tax=Truncatella angustata TaxID=152316 RepID=A0A9P8RL29_9PEZI|nr:uncharacterized protein BKA67DRAFT_669379 [Truncatella angustata]KAH6645270.1 hypothetical protein BKA67DRAFT_669379 [Truncatella angustata]